MQGKKWCGEVAKCWRWCRRVRGENDASWGKERHGAGCWSWLGLHLLTILTIFSSLQHLHHLQHPKLERSCERTRLSVRPCLTMSHHVSPCLTLLHKQAGKPMHRSLIESSGSGTSIVRRSRRMLPMTFCGCSGPFGRVRFWNFSEWQCIGGAILRGAMTRYAEMDCFK